MLHPTNPQEREYQYRGPGSYENVGDVDRWISGLFGCSLLLGSLRRGGLFGLIGAGIGSAMIYRGVTGHCAVQESLDMSDRGRHNAPAPAETIAGAAGAAAAMAGTADAAAAQKPHIRTTTSTRPDKVQEASEESFPASDPPAW